MGKAHYIEVCSESDNDEEQSHEPVQGPTQGKIQGKKHQTIGSESSHAEGQAPILASMSGFPRYHTLKIREIIAGHKVTLLVDGGASRNFIDAELVERREIPTTEFDDFTVIIPGKH